MMNLLCKALIISTIITLLLLRGSTAISECKKYDANDKIVNIGFMSRYKSSRVILGALPLAVEHVNNNPDLLPGKTLAYHAVDIALEESAFPIRNMTEMMLKNNVLAFIGPDDRCKNEALVSSAWNIPMISYHCAELAVSNKSVYPTFSRTSLGPPSKLSFNIISLLKHFNWLTFLIIADSRQWTKEVAQAIKDLAERNNLTVIDMLYYSDYIPAKFVDLEEIVEKTYKITRIYVFVGENLALEDFVRVMQNKKLLETGNYMVVSVNDEIYEKMLGGDVLYRSRDVKDNILNHPFISRTKNKGLKIESYKCILKLTLSSPRKNMSDFYEKIRVKAYQRFKIPYHKSIAPTISIYAAYLYDAVMIYAQAATEVLLNKGDLRDGKSLMENYIFNRSYSSIQGFDVHIDENGNAEGNFSVFSLQYCNDSRMMMQQIGSFLYHNHNELPQFRFINDNTTIHWVKGRKPIDEPKCGFYDEKCLPDLRYWISGIFLIMFTALVSAFLIKHYRYEHKLACLLWKVDHREITFLRDDSNEDTSKNYNYAQYRRYSLACGDSRRAYTTIGFYRGNFVAIKKVYKRSVDLTRNIRKELIQMRELRHENIVNFIGASVENSKIYILTSYCARGSLENVLSNEDLAIDYMFVSSLVFDILKGMVFLQDSDIGSHGNLRSSNCLVDSRWCVKITDFGLNEFKQSQDEPDKEERDIKRSLWKAPELLRISDPPIQGTQKGDVYSFAILLYEIFGRKGPFGFGGNTSHSASFYLDIIENIKNPQNNLKLYRPPLDKIDCSKYVKDCIEMCWDEDPDKRPDLRLVRIKLKHLQQGLKPNIFDNIMALMENHAFNLETLVQERTHLLLEEKKKTELLLLRMLPKSVAESLLRREDVAAESFDCVTILFSDLVGFTELCAKSTPMEVVKMLNDLYTCIDSIISNYDCYKVETIGDAYMVVSGLPISNENHAGVIASLALRVLKCVSKLEIRHRPGELFQIRMGIHSGQVVAGVVGSKMPRYCLFGDTVNTASRMETTSDSLKIHISLATYGLLKKIGGYLCEERGLTFIKGKGEMRTFWLVNEDEDKKMERPNSLTAKEWNSTAPDLLCIEHIGNTNPNSTSRQSFKYCSNKSLDALNRNSCSILNTASDQLPMLNLSKNFPSHDCYMCQKKKYLFNKYQYELRHKCERFRTARTIMSSNSSFSSDGENTGNGCSCSNKNNQINDNFKIVHPSARSPHSAPHISFKE